MEMALGAASWLLDKVVGKLSDNLVAGYVASRELGLNYDMIQTELLRTQALLHEAQKRDITDNIGLQQLLEMLSNKAEDAEDALDEVHYFMIQDELDGTHKAAPELGDDLRSHALHGGHSALHGGSQVGTNLLPLFSRSRKQDDADLSNYYQNTKRAKSDSSSDDQDNTFDRVAMSTKIKSVIEGMHSLCVRITPILQLHCTSNPPRLRATLKRPPTSSMTTQVKLYGRDAIFSQTINYMTSGVHCENLSVLPIVGPGGIGKTTFVQHLYNHEKTIEWFPVRVWVCVSTRFDVLKLTKDIFSCLPATTNDEENETGYGTTNLDQLQKSIASRLKSKRFLLVLDDIWECNNNDDWEKLLAPINKGEENGSMVLVTTRFPKIVEMVKRETNHIQLDGLEPNDFWNFFQLCVFGQDEQHDKEGLIEIARKISTNLKCSPLAAKTVGRLLSKKFSHYHWMEILENKEWLKQEHSNDIIPALKISYDYLPFHLKKCFSYCALYPEDYKFHSADISRFWTSMGIIDSIGHNDKIEHIGSNYMDELVDNGFLMKGDDNCYVMHDLLHELSQRVSSKECAYINCSSFFRADHIPSSIRHISIDMKGTCRADFMQEMDKLKRRINTEKLLSLMFFGQYRMERIVNILKHTFKDIKCLRVLFIFLNSIDSLPQNFSKLIHLRYLKVSSRFGSQVCLPSTVSRFYHLQFLDLSDYFGSICDKLTKNISCLRNLCHFLSNYVFHIPEVGKMKYLKELKKFCVKNEGVGFELRELGSLTQLGGELSIYNLEKVKTKEEASEARLIEKRNINYLRLVWDKKEQFEGAEDVLDGLQPHSNLRTLCIENPAGGIGPSWLCNNICIKNLESLCLEGISWITLPPFGKIPHLRELILISVIGFRELRLDFSCGDTEKSFAPLKSIMLGGMPDLVEWVGDENCLFFPLLESVVCDYCPVLSVLPILGCPRPSTQDLITPQLRHVEISSCPSLSLPPMPHTSNLTGVCVGSKLNFRETKLFIDGYKGELAIQHLGKVEHMVVTGDVPQVSLVDLQQLKSLRILTVQGCRNAVYRELDNGVVLRSVKKLSLREFSVTSKSLSNLFNCFPVLCNLSVSCSDEGQEKVLLQLPSSCSLQKFQANGCKNLLLPAVEDGGALTDLTSLRVFSTESCGRIFSRWSMEEPTLIINLLPPSLKELRIEKETSMQSMGLLSNLTSLTSLELVDCDNLKIDGFNPLIICNLERLRITGCGSVAADFLREVAKTKTLPGALRLKYLVVDSEAVLVPLICRRLTGTLKALWFKEDKQALGFTEEQDQALQLLHSLEILTFSECDTLRSLPEGLHCLPSLKHLCIQDCPQLRSLPKRGLPASLEGVYVEWCSKEFEKEVQLYKKLRLL